MNTELEEEGEVNDEDTQEIEDPSHQSTSRPAPPKKRKPSKSYGAALLDFNEVFMEKYKESNKEFLEGQAMLQKQQQEFEKKMAEDDRDFLRSLFQAN